MFLLRRNSPCCFLRFMSTTSDRSPAQPPWGRTVVPLEAQCLPQSSHTGAPSPKNKTPMQKLSCQGQDAHEPVHSPLMVEISNSAHPGWKETKEATAVMVGGVRTSLKLCFVLGVAENMGFESGHTCQMHAAPGKLFPLWGPCPAMPGQPGLTHQSRLVSRGNTSSYLVTRWKVSHRSPSFPRPRILQLLPLLILC